MIRLFLKVRPLFVSIVLAVIWRGSVLSAQTKPLEAPKTPPTAIVERALAEALKGRVTLQFNAVTLDEVIKSLRDRHKITINFDRLALGDSGIDPKQLVSCELAGLQLQSALDLMLPGLGLDWVVVDDAVLITTPARAAEMIETRFYNFSDLPVEIEDLWPLHVTDPPEPAEAPTPPVERNAPAPPAPEPKAKFDSGFETPNDRFAPAATNRRPSPPTFDPPGQPNGQTSVRMIELIVTSVKANWKDQPPLGRPIRPLSNHPHILVIRQPQRVHREIETLFTRLRTELKRTGGRMPDELVTLSYTIGRDREMETEAVTQLMEGVVKAVALAQLAGNQNAAVQQQILKIAEQRREAAGSLSEQVGAALVELVEPNSWQKKGGKGELRALPGLILVKQSPEVHALIQRTLFSDATARYSATP